MRMKPLDVCTAGAAALLLVWHLLAPTAPPPPAVLGGPGPYADDNLDSFGTAAARRSVGEAQWVAGAMEGLHRTTVVTCRAGQLVARRRPDASRNVGRWFVVACRNYVADVVVNIIIVTFYSFAHSISRSFFLSFMHSFFLSLCLSFSFFFRLARFVLDSAGYDHTATAGIGQQQPNTAYEALPLSCRHACPPPRHDFAISCNGSCVCVAGLSRPLLAAAARRLGIRQPTTVDVYFARKWPPVGYTAPSDGVGAVPNHFTYIEVEHSVRC